MKKYGYLPLGLFLLLLFTQVTYGQIKIGSKAGLSLGKLSDGSQNIYSRNSTSKSGLDFGIFMEIPVSAHFSVQPEGLLANRGGKRNGLQPVDTGSIVDALVANGLSLDVLNQLIIANGGSAITDANPLFANFRNETDLNYLEIPILGKLTWGNNLRFYVNTGPYFGFLLKAHDKTKGSSKIYLDSGGTQPLQLPNPLFDPNNPNGQPPFIEFPEQSFDANTDVKDGLRTFAFGVHTGLGVIKRLNSQHELFFDVRGSYSFISLQKNKVFGSSKVGGIIFSLGYTFALRKAR